MYSEFCNLNDRISYEPIQYNCDNVLCVKSRICKAVIRICIKQQSLYSNWMIDFRNSKVVKIVNEFVDDIFDSLVSMSSPYNMHNSVESMADAFTHMGMNESQDKYNRVYLTEYELWNKCCTDSMTNNSTGELYIVRVLSLYTYEKLCENMVKIEEIQPYISTLSLSPAISYSSAPAYICMNDN